VLIRDVFIREMEATARQLAGPDASPLEVLLCQLVALTHFDATHRDIGALEAEANGCTAERAEFLSRQRNRSTARFLAAARGLATVRRLALPVLQVFQVDASAATPPGIAAEPAQESGPRLRIGGRP
jgi:hypothetical protein